MKIKINSNSKINNTMSTLSSNNTPMIAIALNNVGVTLLQRRCYREAMAVFNDSFSLMQLLLENDPNNNKSTNTVLNNNEDYSLDSIANEFLQSASTMLVKSSSSSSTATSKKDIDNFKLNVLCTNRYNNNSNILLKDAAHVSPTSFTGYALRIDNDNNVESIADLCDNNKNSIQLESAIVLFNMGTACRCYAYEVSNFTSSVKTSTSSSSSNKSMLKKINDIYEKGLKLSSASYDIIIKLMNNETNIYDAKYQGLLIMMILQNLIHITSQCNNNIELSREYYRRLGDIRFELLSLEEDESQSLSYQEISENKSAGAA